MHKLRTAAMLSCAAALGGSALAGAAPASRHHHHQTTIRLYATIAQLELIDLSDPGFNLGDESVFSDDLWTHRNGRRLGFDGGTCTVTRVEDAATQTGKVLCRVTFSLAHGQISTQTLVPVAHAALSGTHTEAITGGTGRYRGASGQATLKFLDSGAARVTLAIAR